MIAVVIANVVCTVDIGPLYSYNYFPSSFLPAPIAKTAPEL